MSRLGHYLVQEGILSQSDRLMIKRESAANHGSFARSILALGVLDEDELSALFASKTSFRQAAKDILKEIDRSLKGMLPNHILAWLEVVPLSKVDGQLTVAMVDPTDIDVINQLAFFTGLRIRPVIATRSAIMRGLGYYGARINLGESRFESFIKNHGRKTQALKVSASDNYQARQVQRMAKDEELERRRNSALDRDLAKKSVQTASHPSSAKADAGDGSDADLDSLEAELRAEGQVDSGAEVPAAQVSDEPPAGADLNDAALAAVAPDEPLDEANIGLEVDIPIDFLDDDEIAAKAAASAEELGSEPPAVESSVAASASAGATAAPGGMAAGGGLFDMDDGLEFDSPTDNGPSAALSAEAVPTENVDSTISEDEVMADADIAMGGADTVTDSPVEAQPESADASSIEMDLTDVPSSESSSDMEADVLAETLSATSTEQSAEIPLEMPDEMLSETIVESPVVDEVTLDVVNAQSEVTEHALSEALGEAVPSIEPLHEDPQDLMDVDLSDRTDLVPEPVVGELKASASHAGVAILNKVMVQLQIMTSRKKAMDKMADAAVKVGIPSGLVMSTGPSGVMPGIMWDSKDHKVATADELPPMISQEFVANLKSTTFWGAGWVPLDQVLQPDQHELLDLWPEVAHRPNYICGWDGANLSHVGFANFNQENDHEGLKSTFSEVLRAVSAKP